MAKLIILNPSDRDWTRHRYVLSFGAVATTHLMVYANGLDSALEECADWLADNAPGHIMKHGSPKLAALYHEACKETGNNPDDPDDELEADSWELATADLIHTEAGYLTSYEWFITLEDPTRAEVKAFISELAERHYSDEPLVAIA